MEVSVGGAPAKKDEPPARVPAVRR